MATYNIGPGQTYETFTELVAAVTLQPDDIVDGGGNTFREQWTVNGAGTSGHPVIVRNAKIYGSEVPASWAYEEYAPSSTPSKVQQPNAISETDASVTRNWGTTPIEGNLLLAYGYGNANISGASISGWTLAVSTQCSSSVYIGLWYKIASTGESSSVTLNWTSSTSTQMVLQEWSGMSSTPLDKTANTNTTGSTVTSRTSGTTSSTTINSELVVALFGFGNTVTAQSFSNSFTSEFTNNAFLIYCVSKVITSAAAQETTMSWTTARMAGGCIATFKAADSITPRDFYYTSQTADPVTVWFVGTNGVIHLGTKQANKVDLETEYDWWWDDPNNRLYVYAGTDPLTRYSSVEVSSATRNRGIFWTEDHHDYLVVDDVEMAFITGVGVVIRSYSEVKNCYVHHIGNQTGGHSFGIEINAGVGSWVHHNTIHDTDSSGVWLCASWPSYIIEDNIIENNTIYNCQNYGIFGYADATTSAAERQIIRKNNIYHTEDFVLRATKFGYGISIYGLTGMHLIDYQILNNRILVQKIGISIGDYVDDPIIANNTILSTNGQGVLISALASGVVVKNNLLVGATLYGVNILDISKIAVCDYNVWYAPGSTAFVRTDNTNNYTSNDFATYKTATGFDTHSLWQEPKVISSLDFHLQKGSPCQDTGTPIAGIHDQPGHTDFGGAKSPQRTNPSIGAYEFIRPVIRGRVMPGK